MSVVGEAFLAAAFEMAIEKLATPIFRDFGHFLGVDKALRKLAITLKKIQAVLNDAEAKQISDASVQIWLDSLKEVAYDAEDVLDEFATHAFQHNQQKKLTKMLSLPKDVKFKRQLAAKIEDINERLDEIAKERDDLGLKEGVGLASIKPRYEERLTSSLIVESDVVGRKDDKKKLVEVLVSDENCLNDVGVIPIIGMGGLGKTTLAQLLVNDPAVCSHFDLKAWICVSDDFHVRRLTKSILESLDKKPCDFVDLDTLQTSLRDKLRGKKFLIVLDDVWNEKERDWELLRLPLRVGAMGSKIIVTTRSKKVASIMGTLQHYHLEVLSDDDCWSLFKQRAFVNGDEEAHPNLVPIGRGIANKCRGLPLAAKALGGLLHAETEVDQWNMILHSDLWELEEDENGILPALRLSYNQLPAYLKQCFVYCSIFPKDYDFDKEDLVLLWMAEGFVLAKGKKSLEDAASNYFEDLLRRSFFQQSKSKHSMFVMHDLIHDLAQSAAGERCFRMEGDKSEGIPEKVRHSSVLADTLKSFTLDSFQTANGLRTLLLLSNRTSRGVSNMKISRELIRSLKCLRSLDMSRIAIKDFPDTAGDLLHMRYLDLSHTEITELPESVCNLFNLQTLILAFCNKLTALPKGTKNLVNLRHLNLTECWHLKFMPPSFRKLTSLQRLHRFVVGKGDECGINELKDINELRKTLCIDRVEDIVNVEEAKEASLKNKKYIHKLVLKWCRSQYKPDAIDAELLECLEPHTNLRELVIDVYPGHRFPNWMGNPLFSLIENIKFTQCNYCESLPPLGQLPNLKTLTICLMEKLHSIGQEFYGNGKTKGFPSLKKLKLEDMRSLGAWQEIDQGEFPVLEELALLNCPSVANLPKFPALKDLLLDDCHEAILSSVHSLTSLSSLKILNFRKTRLLPNDFLQPLTALKELKIQHFYRLEALQDEAGLRDLQSLQRLEILCCPKLRSLTDEGLPCMLHHLSIGMCSNMMELPNGLENLSSLQELNISKCPRLASIPDNLPRSLKTLIISGCGNLESLPTGLHELSNLEYLSVGSCQRLASLPVSGAPSTLRSLSIRECASLAKKCAEGGEDWPKIQHVPEKHISGIE